MDEAERAIRERLETTDFQRSFLVEAGAGAGKSHTVCRRILHQLLDGQDPGTIAAITFTEKATLELQEKLDRQALEYDAVHPGTRLAALTAKVHISTIHSFCKTALELFPLETGGELQVLPDEGRRAKDFFRTWTARDTGGKVAAFEAFGGSVRDLENTFAAMAEDGHMPALSSAADVKARQSALDRLTALANREQIAQAEKPVGYDLALGVLVPAMEVYLSQLDRAGLVSFSGLLTRTRDLVRDDPAARALLHRRYQVFYVDEFQDTDPIQAELLFLITDRDGKEKDWRRCRPAPGSLFLVGDPKQAIYRFRGADLGVYKQVKDLFTNKQAPVGKVVQLRANFRSVPEICSFANQVFAPRDEKTGDILTLEEQEKNRSSKTVTGLLDDGAYQAAYVPMESQWKIPGRRAVFSYPVQLSGTELSEADRVARFIQRATAGGFTLPDREGNPVPVRCGDFLILTWKKSAAGRYLDALSRLGVPVSFDGRRPLEENPQMRRLTAWLQWLLETGDEVALLSVLRDCFGLGDFEAVRQLKAASQVPLTALAGWKEKRDEVTNSALKPLLDALADMDAVLADCRALPPMAFLEKLAEERLFRERDAAAPRERAQQYGDMRLLFSQLRQYPQGDFPALARAALTLCQGALDRELPLAPSPDAVRVMNLHKAKGLEGKIVILASDTRPNRPPQKAGGVYPIYRTNRYGNGTLLYAPGAWSNMEKEEKSCLEAERVRLDYVAATRAEQLLLIAGNQTNRKRKSCWSAMADKATPVSAQDPQWGSFFAPLLDSGGSATPASAPAPAPAPRDLTESRESLIQAQSLPTSLHASPSALDKSHARRPLDPEEAAEAPLDLVPEEAAGELEAPEREEAAPHGADWGTAVHRVMELCVSQKARDKEAARPLIDQALRELIPPLSRMTGTQKELLFGGDLPESDGAGAEFLARKLEKAVSFWFDEASPLRRLTGTGTCYCELPFHLTLPREDESWGFLRDRLDCREDFAGSISVSGILDLAVLTGEGWHIVDYKTDRLRPGEDDAAYRRRLAGEYEAQLNAYARILSRLSGKAVLDTRLCAVPLGGEWIPIPKNA